MSFSYWWQPYCFWRSSCSLSCFKDLAEVLVNSFLVPIWLEKWTCHRCVFVFFCSFWADSKGYKKMNIRTVGRYMWKYATRLKACWKQCEKCKWGAPQFEPLWHRNAKWNHWLLTKYWIQYVKQSPRELSPHKADDELTITVNSSVVLGIVSLIVALQENQIEIPLIGLFSIIDHHQFQ